MCATSHNFIIGNVNKSKYVIIYKLFENKNAKLKEKEEYARLQTGKPKPGGYPSFTEG